MKSSVVWTDQVEAYVRGKAPEPRRALWAGIKGLGQWDGEANPPHVRFLEDDLAGYIRLRVDRHRVVFREDFHQGRRRIICLFAGPRSTVYEALSELLLDELATPKATSKAG